ncbi:MAG: glycosyltransferase family 25 protein [Rickettsiales bacterium]|jgi:glycosyl transferase family 25|nr:glycosyltransferase family 25 protein [Rickettsiales bacterium]
MLKNLKTYVINLGSARGRMARMAKRLKSMGLPFERIEAVKGEECKDAGPKVVDRRRHVIAHAKEILPNEIGCYLSHYNAMKKFLDSGAKYALILEDDMEFSPEFSDVLAALLKRDDWDVVKLNGGHGGGNVGKRELVRRVGACLALNGFHQSKSGAYVLARRAAKAYVSKMLPMFVPFDHELVKYWKYGLRGFSAAPFPAREEGGASTIDYSRERSRRRAWAKPSSALYKSYIALRRAIHVLFALIGYSCRKNSAGNHPSAVL